MKTLTAAFLLPLAALSAQREQATFEWQKRASTISYGAVPAAPQGLTVLPIEQSLPMGINEASTWLLAMPVLTGDTWIAPGHYRISLMRTDEIHCAVVVDGSQHALGGEQAARLSGEIRKAGKASKKLSIEWAKNGPTAAGNQSAKLQITFGPSEWRSEVLVLGNKTVNVPGGKLAVFCVPAKQLEARESAVPIAVLSKGKDGQWNLLLGKSDARLVPWMEAPTEDRGFGPITAPDAKLQTVGTATVVEGEADKALEVLELR
ncbi:MAG: hypothetical protein ABIP94_21575, partial [Planctomycetota bacterium]